MRTGEELRWLANRADDLQLQRGDTEWSDADRERVHVAYDLLRSIGAPVRRYMPRGGW